MTRYILSVLIARVRACSLHPAAAGQPESEIATKVALLKGTGIRRL